MRWKSGRRSSNIEDRRSMKAPVRGGLKMGGGLGLLVIVVGMFMGKDLTGLAQLITSFQQQGSAVSPSARMPSSNSATGTPPRDEAGDFVSVILADTEDTWTSLLKRSGIRYVPPKLVLFREAVQSACGLNSSAVGPFYCPADKKVYLDLGFFEELHRRFGAPGDFAQAYVLAHEVGHHIQNLLGTSRKVHSQRRRLSKVEGNALSVKQELQADCYAGVWAHHANSQRKLLEAGDIEEGLNAAAAIGDDRLQKQAQGHVSPESWTHGSSKQRVTWFRAGFGHGDMDLCNTFQL